MFSTAARVWFLNSHYTLKVLRDPLKSLNVRGNTQRAVEHIIDLSDSKEATFPNPLAEKKSNKLKGSSGNGRELPIISCKRPEYNHYRNKKYTDFEKISLASKGWKRTKSKGDHFSIHVHTPDYEPLSRKEPGSFEDTKLENVLIEILRKNGISEPSEIQSKAIPVVLSGKNCVIAAETGCGKTLAYLAPMIQKILKRKMVFSGKRELNSPIGLIITPGRDLAEQIYDVCCWFSKELDLDCKVIIGGKTKRKILAAEFDEVDILISSLGALSKLTTTGIYSLRNVQHVVLDEADTLLDDSFNDLLLHFLKRIQFQSQKTESPVGAQIVLTSATMPTSLADLLKETIDVDLLERITTDKLHGLLPHVKQTFHRVGLSEKPAYLLQFARTAAKNKKPTIIFCNKSVSSDWVSIFLNQNNIKCVNLNGDMPSEMRLGRFKQFQDGEINFLSTTDVCSRGLDTVRTKCVINYEFPFFISDYIHRCGRTGRLGSHENCEIINLVSNKAPEVELVKKIELAVRMMTSFENVNANISRILFHRLEKQSKVIYEILNEPPPDFKK